MIRSGGLVHRRLGIVLAVAAVAVVITLPWWADRELSGTGKTGERIEELERDLRRLRGVVGELDVRVTHVESAQDATKSWLENALPNSARWIPLVAGEGEQWEFGAAGRCQVQFLKVDDQGRPVFRIHNRAMEISSPLEPGIVLRGVDDLGDEQRFYATSLHRLVLDQDGHPSRALISQTVETR